MNWNPSKNNTWLGHRHNWYLKYPLKEKIVTLSMIFSFTAFHYFFDDILIYMHFITDIIRSSIRNVPTFAVEGIINMSSTYTNIVTLINMSSIYTNILTLLNMTSTYTNILTLYSLHFKQIYIRVHRHSGKRNVYTPQPREACTRMLYIYIYTRMLLLFCQRQIACETFICLYETWWEKAASGYAGWKFKVFC